MGYVVHRHHRWYAVGYEGLDPLTGKDRRRWHRATDENDARRLAAALPPATPATGSHGITVARFLRTRWLPARAGLLRPTTLYRYEQMTDHYVVPHIGRVPLRRLTTTQLHDLYQHLLRAGSAQGGPLAPKTVLNVHQILRTALGHAEREGLVARNVAALIPPPCHGRAPEQACWTAEQLAAFLDATIDHPLGPPLWLAAMTGMRRGEVLGLRWGDLDTTARTLTVRRSVSCTGYKTHITPTKTRTSRRLIDLDDTTVQMLSRVSAGRGVVDLRSPMFVQPDGQPVHPHALSQAFARLRQAAGLPSIRLHDLRHTHATLMLKANIPLKVVSERLGHSTPAFTMAVYQHVLPGMQADAAAVFARLVTPPTASTSGAENEAVVPVDSR